MLAQHGVGQGLGALAEHREVRLAPGAVGQRMLGLLDAGIGGFPCPVLQLLRLHRHCCLRRLPAALLLPARHALALARQQPLRIRIALAATASSARKARLFC
jgi:hypothetical protein